MEQRATMHNSYALGANPSTTPPVYAPSLNCPGGSAPQPARTKTTLKSLSTTAQCLVMEEGPLVLEEAEVLPEVPPAECPKGAGVELTDLHTAV